MARALQVFSHKSLPLKAVRGLCDGVRFPLLFSLLLVLSFVITCNIPYSLEYQLREAIASGSVFLAKCLGLDTVLESRTVFTIEGKRLFIISECTGASYILIFASAVMAYPSKLNKKLYGLIFGIALISLLNLIRIVFLGYVGGHYPQYFELFHYYLWEGGFLFAVLLIWAGWVNSRFLVSMFKFSADKKKPKNINRFLENWKSKCLLIALTCLTFAAFSGPYLIFLAEASDWLIHTLHLGGGTIRSDEKGLFIIFWGQKPWEVSVGIYYLLPFIFLMIMSGTGLLRSITGTLLLMLIQALAVVAVYAGLLNNAVPWQIAVIIGAAVTVSPWFAAFGLWKMGKAPLFGT